MAFGAPKDKPREPTHGEMLAMARIEEKAMDLEVELLSFVPLDAAKQAKAAIRMAIGEAIRVRLVAGQ